MNIKSKPLGFLLSVFLFLGAAHVQAASDSSEIVSLAWKASKDGDTKTLSTLADEMLKTYGDKAKDLSAQLSNFPSRDKIDDYKILSDVATCLFIQAEALMHQGKNEEAKAEFKSIIAQYPWAQSFDPSRGAYWSIAEKSQSSIDVMEGKAPKEAAPLKKAPKTIPVLAYPGKEEVVDWTKYGKFLNVGTKDYHYQITDEAGLEAALGESIYPNIADVYRDHEYRKALKQGRLEGSHWDFVNTTDLQAAVFKWDSAKESWGVRLFYIGTLYEKAHMLPRRPSRPMTL